MNMYYWSDIPWYASIFKSLKKVLIAMKFVGNIDLGLSELMCNREWYKSPKSIHTYIEYVNIFLSEQASQQHVKTELSNYEIMQLQFSKWFSPCWQLGPRIRWSSGLEPTRNQHKRCKFGAQDMALVPGPAQFTMSYHQQLMENYLTLL